jgi:hypothetical protein
MLSVGRGVVWLVLLLDVRKADVGV